MSDNIAQFSMLHFQKSFLLLFGILIYSVFQMWGPNLLILNLNSYYSLRLCTMFSLGDSRLILSVANIGITSGKLVSTPAQEFLWTHETLSHPVIFILVSF